VGQVDSQDKPYCIQARYVGDSTLELVQVLREWHEWGRYKTRESMMAGLLLAQSQASSCQRYEFRTEDHDEFSPDI
jgi:hypothetical protein